MVRPSSKLKSARFRLRALDLMSRDATLSASRDRGSCCTGFTLIELMIVISIILILVAIAVPMYEQSVIRAKEAVLRQDLKTMRDQIDNYTMDKEKAPQALQDLVESGYLRIIPKDPFTGSADTWQVETSDTLSSLDQTESGISDVHSGSSTVGSDGQAYSSW